MINKEIDNAIKREISRLLKTHKDFKNEDITLNDLLSRGVINRIKNNLHNIWNIKEDIYIEIYYQVYSNNY